MAIGDIDRFVTLAALDRAAKQHIGENIVIGSGESIHHLNC